jgi:hypothetical protein
MQGNVNLIDLWYPVSMMLGLSVVTPSGVVVTGPTPDSGVSTIDGNVVIAPDMRPSGREWWVNVTAEPTSYSISAWSFRLTSLAGSIGRWDAWTEPGQFVGSNGTLAKLYAIDPSDTLDAPGTAVGVLTVGGYMTKSSWYGRCTACIQWAQANGLKGLYTLTRTASAVGDLIYDSSAGPTRDGRIKPEIVAPAGAIAAAKASTAGGNGSGNVCAVPGSDETISCPDDPDDYHRVWVGTSLAAPHVGGVIALMLQMNPYLRPNQITKILESDARLDNFTGTIDKSVGSPLWGWGKVNALRSTLDAPNQYSVRVQVDAVGLPIQVDLSLDGTTVDVLTLNATRTITLEFTGGTYHTLELTPIIDPEPGTRYVLSDPSWTFSSGGTKTFAYQLQYYLQVNSSYGYANGTGWYNANTTATASVVPANVNGYEFQGWTGSVSSGSPTVVVKMDSNKELSATWTQSKNSATPLSAEGLLLAIAIVIAAVFMKRQSLRDRLRPHPSAD